MKFHLLFLSSVSATFELDNDAIYESEEAYDVLLNSKRVLQGFSRNVFSLFPLSDDTDYTVQVGEDTLPFHTPKASLILHLKDVLPALAGDDTLRIQTAIALLNDQGVLVFDEGVYHVTSLFLKSHITLAFMKGSYLYGDPEKKDYPQMPGEYPLPRSQNKIQFSSWEGAPFPGMSSLLNGFHLEDVALVGEGVIDGRASESQFWDDVKHLPYARPHLLYLNDCKNVFVSGLSFRNSPSWTIHPYFSEHLGFYDLYIENPKDSPNTDGLNPQSCRNVDIIGLRFSVGDDCIALKSGKIYLGKTYQRPTENVTIRNCYMHEGHGAIVLGSEAGAGLKNLCVERCLFEGTDRGLRIKSRRGRGKDSIIDGVSFSHIRMKGVKTPLAMSMFYYCDPDGKESWVQNKEPAPVDDGTPYLGSFKFNSLVCTDAEYALGFFYGLPERPIASILISDSSFTVKKTAGKGFPEMMCGIEECSKVGFYFANVDRVELHQVVAEGYVGEEAILHGVSSFKKT